MAAELKYNGEWLIPLQQGYRVSSGYSAQLSGGYPASGLRRQAVTVSASYRLKDAAMIAWWWQFYEANRGQPLIAILDTAGYPAEHTARIIEPPQFSEYAGHTAVVSVVMTCSHSVPDAEAHDWDDWWAGGGGGSGDNGGGGSGDNGGGSAEEYAGFMLARYNFFGATQSTIKNTMPGPDAVFVGEISPQPTFATDGILSTMRQPLGVPPPDWWARDAWWDTQVTRSGGVFFVSCWVALDVSPHPDSPPSGIDPYASLGAQVVIASSGGGSVAVPSPGDVFSVSVLSQKEWSRVDIEPTWSTFSSYTDLAAGGKLGLMHVACAMMGDGSPNETIRTYVNGELAETALEYRMLQGLPMAILWRFGNTEWETTPFSGAFVFADYRMYEGIDAADVSDLAARIYLDGPR